MDIDKLTQKSQEALAESAEHHNPDGSQRGRRRNIC